MPTPLVTACLFVHLILVSGQGIDLSPAKLLSINPDKNYYTHEYIISRGWLDEFHSLVTNDGYTIALHRIINPYRASYRGPVLFQGTLGGYAKTWLRNSGKGYVNESAYPIGADLGFEAAKNGFDVWLLETRGSQVYTYNHTIYNADRDLEYWDFSLDEFAIFDYSRAVDHIRAVTGRDKVAFVALAFSNTAYLFLASTVPRFNRVMQPVIFLGPCYTQVRSQIPLIQRIALQAMLPVMTMKRGADRPQYLARAVQNGICNYYIMQVLLCNPLLYLLAQTPVAYPGGSGTVNYDRFATYITAVANDLSSWTQGQAYTFSFSDQRTMFDVDPQTNLQRYGTTVAPNYMPELITNTEMHFFYATSDGLFDPADVEYLKSRMPVKPRSETVIPIPWSAMSFQDGEPEDVIKWVNIPVINILKSYL